MTYTILQITTLRISWKDHGNNESPPAVLHPDVVLLSNCVTVTLLVVLAVAAATLRPL